MNKTPTVHVSGNAYVVTDVFDKEFVVQKDRTCSCGRQSCWHIGQVKRYLQEGGERAPDKEKIDDSFPYLEDSLSLSQYCTVPQTGIPPEKQPVIAGVYFQEFSEMAQRIQKKKVALESSGEISPKMQYWMDLRTLSSVEMCRKWQLPFDYREVITIPSRVE